MISARLARQARPLINLRTLNLYRAQVQTQNNQTRPFQSGPAPPRLPPDQQAEFERLQRIANTQEGFNATSVPDFTSTSTSTSTSQQSQTQFQSNPQSQPQSQSQPDAIPTPLRKGAPPEFEGDVNPRTGEVGGPKNEPLRWGPSGDYSFNGRVTDF